MLTEKYEISTLFNPHIYMCYSLCMKRITTRQQKKIYGTVVPFEYCPLPELCSFIFFFASFFISLRSIFSGSRLRSSSSNSPNSSLTSSILSMSFGGILYILAIILRWTSFSWQGGFELYIVVAIIL